MQSHSDLMQSLDSISNKIKQTSEQAERTLLEQQEKAFKAMSEKSATIYANAIKDQQTQAKQFALKAVKTSHKWAIINLVLVVLSLAMGAWVGWGFLKAQDLQKQIANLNNTLHQYQIKTCTITTMVNGKPQEKQGACVKITTEKNNLDKGWKTVAENTE